MGNSSRRTHRALGGAVAAVALTTLVGAARSADWPQLRGDAQHTGVSTESLAPPLALLWRYTGGFQNANTASATVADGVAYFVTKTTANQGGLIFAVDAQTGEKKWSFPKSDTGLVGGHIFTTTPTLEKGRVYVGASDGGMYVLDAKTGEEIIRFNTGRAINSSPVVEDGILYFGSNSGTLYALNPETGESAPGWRNYNAGDSIVSSPLMADTMMVLTTGDNVLHGIKRATGIPKWKLRLPYGASPNSLTYSDGSLYVPSGRQLFAIQPASGTTRWSSQLPEDILAAPVATGGIVYVACRSGSGIGARLYAVKGNNGRAYWETPVDLPNAPTAAPVIAGDILYIAGNRGTLMAVSREDGKLLWQYRMEFSTNRPAVTAANFQGNLPSTGTNAPAREVTVAAPLSVSDGTLFVVSNDGTLSAFRPDAPDSTGPVASEQYPKAGSSVSGKPPFVAALKLTDLGSGVDVSTIKGKLDGKEIETNYDPIKGWIYFATQSTGKLVDPPLPNGRHTITFTARDFMGNETESTWSFVVDNNLPATTRTAPVAAPKPRGGITGAPSTGGNAPAAPGGGGAGRRGGRNGAGAAGGGRAGGL